MQGWRQLKAGVSLGMVKGTHTGFGSRATLLPWLSNGQFDYYGMFARPQTSYYFKLKLDLDAKRMTAWVSGRGDDDWCLLAEDIPLQNPIDAVDSVRVEQTDGAPDAELVIRSAPWPEGEQVRPCPASEKSRQVVDGAGFKFQSMRSLWNQTGRHVVIARTNPKTVAEEFASGSVPPTLCRPSPAFWCAVLPPGGRTAAAGRSWSVEAKIVGRPGRRRSPSIRRV